MATTIYYGAGSLDGYLAGPGDDLDWLLGYDGSYEGAEAEGDPIGDGGSYEGFYAGVEALVMGSATYEWLLDHLDVAGGGGWPYKGKPTWVLSSRPAARSRERSPAAVASSARMRVSSPVARARSAWRRSVSR